MSEPEFFPRPVFLMGCPRSGTTFLARLLAAHSEILYLEEPRTGFFLHHAKRLLGRMLEVEQKGRSMNWSEASSENVLHQKVFTKEESEQLDEENRWRLRQLLAGFWKDKAQEQNKTVMLDKTPENGFYLNDLEQCFPEAVFIHLIRDGREVAASYVERDLFTQWQISLSGKTRMEYVAELWSQHIEAGRRQAAALGNRYYEVRYESLILNPARELSGLLSWLGLGLEPQVEHFIQAGRDGVRDGQRQKFLSVLGPEDVAAFESAAGKILEELGYLPARQNLG